MRRRRWLAYRPLVRRQAAALVLEPDAETLDIDELLRHCEALLASYKRPTLLAVVAQLPRNTNTGKVQRRQVAAELARRLATP